MVLAASIVTSHLYGQLKRRSMRSPTPRRRRASILVRDVRRQLASIALAAAAAALAPPLAGCGEGGSTSGALPLTSAPQAVDRLERHPRAIDPSVGVPAGRAGVVARRDARCHSPAPTSEIRRELAASGIPDGDAAGLTEDGLAVAPLGRRRRSRR